MMKTSPSVLFLVRRLSGGGAERVTAILCNYFARNGIRTYLLELDGFSNDYPLDSLVSRTSVCSGPVRPLNIVKKLVSVNWACAHLAPDYLFALGSVAKYANHLITRPKRGLIFSERNYPDALFSEKEKASFERLYLRADKVVFQTEDALHCYGSAVQNRGVIILNPVLPDLPQSEGARSNTVVTFARLEPQKNLGLLIHAFKRFSRNHFGWSLRIYGKGSELESLQGLIKSLDLSGSASVLPFTHNIHQEIINSGMFVSTSDYEGLQNSLMEAMAMGIPCIATDCLGGGARILTDNGKRGLLVPRNDVDELAGAMSRVADEAALSKELSQRGKEIAILCDEDRIAQQWLDLIR